MSDVMSEQETCRTFVVPELRAAGWDKRQIREQYRITNGKIIASARRHRPGNPLVADYVLEYRDDVPLAVVEAKRTKVDAAAGIEQAKRYAQQLELPVAYATNGHEILSKTPPSTDHRCGSSMTRSTSRVSEWPARNRLARTTPSRSLSTEDDDTADQIMAQGKRIYVDGVEVYVWNDVHYQLESDGRTLRLVEYREFVRDRVLSMNLSPTDLRTQWAMAKSRAALRNELQSLAIEPDDLMAKLGHPEADPLDLLINAAWGLPLVSRAERALRVAPFTEMGNVIELGGLFGGRDALHEAIDDLGRHLFDVG